MHPGWFEDTLPGFTPEIPFTVLRLDGDGYESTLICMRNPFDRVHPGELVLIDDDHDRDGCSRATHDYLAEGERSEGIHQAGRGLAYLIER